MASLRNKHVLIQFMLPVKIISQPVYGVEGTKLQTCFFFPPSICRLTNHCYSMHPSHNYNAVNKLMRKKSEAAPASAEVRTLLVNCRNPTFPADSFTYLSL